MKAVIQEMPAHWLAERQRSGAERFDEMWEGVLHVFPTPTCRHQTALLDLTSFLDEIYGRTFGGFVCWRLNVVRPQDEADWQNNYRIPDLVLLDPDRLDFNKHDYVCGPPSVCVEIRSPFDACYEKLEFYADLGVPEVWIIERDTMEPEIFLLNEGSYRAIDPDGSGWLVSGITGLQMKATPDHKLAIRLNRDDATRAEIPE